MDFELAQEHKQLQQSVKNLVEQAILPTIMEYEEKSIFPLEIFRKIGQAGFLKTHIPKLLLFWNMGFFRSAKALLLLPKQ